MTGNESDRPQLTELSLVSLKVFRMLSCRQESVQMLFDNKNPPSQCSDLTSYCSYSTWLLILHFDRPYTELPYLRFHQTRYTTTPFIKIKSWVEPNTRYSLVCSHAVKRSFSSELQVEGYSSFEQASRKAFTIPIACIVVGVVVVFVSWGSPCLSTYRLRA